MASEKHQQHRPRLLVVDDEPVNIQLLTRLFQESCDVEGAANGQIALDMLQAKAYDVILLDIMMPVLNGLEVLRRVRQTKDIAELPIVLISAVSERSDVARGIRLGANDYLTKPLDVDIARARVTTQIMIKQLMDERHRNIGQLQQVNEVKARMMQVASHDLKNPLNNLRMLAKMMRETDDEEQLQQFADMMDNSLSTMLNVIEDFLDNQFVTSNGVAVSLNTVDSAAVIQQVLEQYEVAAYNKQIKLQVEGDTQCLILADSNRLQQVLGNLVSNAIKYSPTDSAVLLRSEVRDGQWRLRVIDQGPGIPAEEHRYLFEPFSTNKISTKPTGGESRTGLGLWIVKQMIELQDGDVGVEFPEEGGSVFWLELALAPHIPGA
jgi:two-component system, sensor histidine kinase and response regulator